MSQMSEMTLWEKLLASSGVCTVLSGRVAQAGTCDGQIRESASVPPDGLA